MAAVFLRSLLLAYVDDGGHNLERRLRLYAGAYMLLAASFLVRAADSAANAAVTGFLLWIAAVALLLLSFTHRRFPAAAVAAAARLAQAALEPLFELL